MEHYIRNIATQRITKHFCLTPECLSVALSLITEHCVVVNVLRSTFAK